MNHNGKHNRLEEEIFSYRVLKDHKIFIYWYDQQVMVLKGRESERFLSRVESANALEAQLIMAKITGNFKRGNERG